MSNEVAIKQDQSLFNPDHFERTMKIAEVLSKSTLIPKHFQGKPADILLAVEHGRELGLPPVQALQSIAVINGKPSLYGDAVVAVIQNHKDYEYLERHPIMNGNSLTGVMVKLKRKKHAEHISRFTIEDAKRAGLWGKSGPWSQYPDQMLWFRALGFGARAIFADALRGISIKEEVEDYTLNVTKPVIDGEKEYATKTDMLKDKLTDFSKKETVIEAEVIDIPVTPSSGMCKEAEEFFAEADREEEAKKPQLSLLDRVKKMINDYKFPQAQVDNWCRKNQLGCLDEADENGLTKWLEFFETLPKPQGV